jgi:phosphoribosylamine---glycine ligase
MRVLVIGQGGREHALCWKLAQSKDIVQLYCAPGNPGIAQSATLVPIAVDAIDDIVQFVCEEKIDFTVVGPELPLSLGIVDRLRQRGKIVFGPTKAAAQLEASKSFSKEIMRAAGVSTAESVTVMNRQQAEEELKRLGLPIVFKADGLAAGKGVFVCLDHEQAEFAIESLYSGSADETVVIEQFLEGREASLIVATDGKRVIPLVPSNDYKRVGEGDTGLNTGGMGTISPTAHLSQQQFDSAVQQIIIPVLKKMAEREMPFSGFLYAGLMIGPQGEVNCLEFNARLGDPETQVILRRLESDLLPILYQLALGDSSHIEEPRWSSDVAVCVVQAAHGYPAEVRKGDLISGIKEAESVAEVVVFQAGTAVNNNGELCSAGGRVLNVTAVGKSIDEARARAYQGCQRVVFLGQHYRRDIGGPIA